MLRCMYLYSFTPPRPPRGSPFWLLRWARDRTELATTLLQCSVEYRTQHTLDAINLVQNSEYRESKVPATPGRRQHSDHRRAGRARGRAAAATEPVILRYLAHKSDDLIT